MLLFVTRNIVDAFTACKKWTKRCNSNVVLGRVKKRLRKSKREGGGDFEKNNEIEPNNSKGKNPFMKTQQRERSNHMACIFSRLPLPSTPYPYIYMCSSSFGNRLQGKQFHSFRFHFRIRNHFLIFLDEKRTLSHTYAHIVSISTQCVYVLQLFCVVIILQQHH